MLAPEIRTDPHSSPARQAEPLEAESSVTTVKVYTRHNRGCSKREQSDWARCNCMKWLYIYRDGKYKLVSAKTRSWERAEQKAREVRDTFDPIRQLQRRLEAQSSADNSQIDIATAVDQFLKEVARLNRAEATCAKYKLTLARLLKMVCNFRNSSHSPNTVGCGDNKALDKFLERCSNQPPLYKLLE
jgi:hypothetical protein